MFTGIIETKAVLKNCTEEGTNKHYWFECPLTAELKIDQSVAHNGVCLTVVAINGNQYKVTAIQETLQRTALGDLKVNNAVNLERCMVAGGRLDGHIVQGHVDTTATCIEINDLNGSTEFVFQYEQEPTHITVEKGSITVNGVSLTVVRSEPGLFSVHIIPFTLEHTGFGTLKKGDRVNLEFDVIGKYVARMMKGYQ
jgi:riboflavin synthase